MTEFFWETADGRVLKPVDIKTDHLVNIITYLWNHVAVAYGLESFPNPMVGPDKGVSIEYVHLSMRNPNHMRTLLNIMIEEYWSRHPEQQRKKRHRIPF